MGIPRRVRDWQRSLQVRRPVGWAVMTGAAFLLGWLLGAVIFAGTGEVQPWTVGAVVAAAVVSKLGWASHRRRRPRPRPRAER
jgi:hypothetical protein